MSTARITTPLPDGISAQDIVATLHNHGQMIKALCPNLIKYEMTDGQKDKIATYAVTDKKPIGEVRSVLVEACWQTGNGKTTTYRLTLKNVPDGVDSHVVAKPPIGTLNINGKWRVRRTHLTEDVEIDGNLIFKKMAKSNVEKTHPEQHGKLIELARV